MEILAPAGSRESLEAAVSCGADAVYLGGNGFQARAFSAGVGDLKEAITYAHKWGVKVYFTLNTVFLDREAEQFLLQAEEAAEAGADAFIIADFGAIPVLRTTFPSMPLHASTQFSIRSPQSAKAFADLGFARLVLAREVTAGEMKEIRDASEAEIEVFCHGALCVCASGRCLMSSLLGERSANRGACAQPCRLRYTLAATNGYFLNTKDLCLADEISALRDMGVTSLKIEGRMKSPLYVAAAVLAYREAVDTGKVSDEAMEALTYTFSRGGFTKGRFGEDPDRFFRAFPGHTGTMLGNVTDVNGNEISVRTNEALNTGDTISAGGADRLIAVVRNAERKDGLLRIETAARPSVKKGDTLYRKTNSLMEKRIRERIRVGREKQPLRAAFRAFSGSPVELDVSLPDGRLISAKGPCAETAHTRAADEHTIRELLCRTGNTPFRFEPLRITMDQDLAIPKSAVNALRREVLQKACAAFTERSVPREPTAFFVAGDQVIRRPSKLAALVHTAEQASACAPLVDILYVPPKIRLENVPPGLTAIPIVPSMSTGEEIRSILSSSHSGVVLTGCLLPDMEGCITDASFNVTNSFAINELMSLGAARITLSQELNSAQLRDLVVPSHTETEVIAYGHQVLMVTEHCPVPCDMKNCRVRNSSMSLKDRTGRSFRIVPDHTDACRVQILNSMPLWSSDILDSVSCDVIRLEFTTESRERCAAICKEYRAAMLGEEAQRPDYPHTRGHLRRGLKAQKEMEE